RQPGRRPPARRRPGRGPRHSCRSPRAPRADVGHQAFGVVPDVVRGARVPPRRPGRATLFRGLVPSVVLAGYHAASLLRQLSTTRSLRRCIDIAAPGVGTSPGGRPVTGPAAGSALDALAVAGPLAFAELVLLHLAGGGA